MPRPTADELMRALVHVTNAFVEHLEQDAHEKGVSVESLCPCWTTEIEPARALYKNARTR